MSPASRRRWRRRLLLAGVVPLLLAVALAVETALVLGHDRAGRAALASGDPATAAAEYAANRSPNLLEPWVAPYDEATARFRAGDPLAAVDAYTDALALAPDDQVCRVRADLATSHEAAGLDLAEDDGAGDQAAREQWSAGLASLRGCDDDRALEVATRLEALLAGSDDAAQEPAADPGGDEQPDQPDQPDQPGGSGGAGGPGGAGGSTPATQRQDLAERNERGEDRRQRREARSETRADGSGGSRVGAGSGGTGPPAYSW